MNQYTCLAVELEQAADAGFNEHFHFLKSGFVLLISVKKEYCMEEMSVTMKVFYDFHFNFYYITTYDGQKGTAIEYWVDLNDG